MEKTVSGKWNADAIAKKEREMADCIEAFRVTFRLRFGTTPYVSVSPKGTYGGRLSLSELLGIVNGIVNGQYKDASVGVLTQRRFKGLILYRHVMCRVAKTLGYTNSEIGRRWGMDRVSVLHADRSISQKMEIGDRETVECMESVLAEIESYLANRESGMLASGGLGRVPRAGKKQR